MIIWRVAGLAVLAGLALFLLSLLLKLALTVLAVLVVGRIAGGFIANRFFTGQLGRGRWQPTHVIAIDNPAPAFRATPIAARYDRVIPIN